MKNTTYAARTARSLSLTLLATSVAYANHGPSTSGAGVGTGSAETLRAGRFEFGVRADWTSYSSVSQADAEAAAIEYHHFDSLDRSLLTTASLAWGFSDDLQLGASIGWYSASNFRDVHAHDEDGDGTIDEIETAFGDPKGLTDLWLNAKWRVMHGDAGQLALMGGIKVPIGTDDETLDNGEVLEPSSQPSTGEMDFMAGVAYSRFLSERMVLDASAAYTLRGSGDEYTVGDRLDAGLAVSYRLTSDVAAFPNYSVSAELLNVWLGEDEERHEGEWETVESSGGNTLYASLGFRVRFNETTALSLAPAIPLSQDLGGEQVEQDIKLLVALSYGF